MMHKRCHTNDMFYNSNCNGNFRFLRVLLKAFLNDYPILINDSNKSRKFQSFT